MVVLVQVPLAWVKVWTELMETSEIELVVFTDGSNWRGIKAVSCISSLSNSVDGHNTIAFAEMGKIH